MMDSMSVSQLNEYARRLIENDILLQMVNVSGEISNYKRHSSGHIYFTLKDQGARVNCVYFKGNNSNLKFEPEDGMSVTVTGTASLYERDGQFQLYIYKMRNDGQGKLYELFEQLKKRLSDEGLFDDSSKKLIPRFPRHIAVLASPTGAAVRDIINITGRRAKNVRLTVVPVPVQGRGAAEQIAKALAYADLFLDSDVIIMARGGGSIEELWAFNEEVLARAVYACKTPVISGVGHETDFTICDFAADLRAPTPSAAAELACEDSAERLLNDRFDSIKTDVQYRFAELGRNLRSIINSAALAKPMHYLMVNQQRMDSGFAEISMRISHKIDSAGKRAEHLREYIDAVNPLKILASGYAVVKKFNGKSISAAEEVKIGERVMVNLHKGAIACIVEEKFNEEKHE